MWHQTIKEKYPDRLIFEGIKIGIPKEFYGEGINKEVKDSLYKTIEEFKKLGAEVEEFSLETLQDVESDKKESDYMQDLDKDYQGVVDNGENDVDDIATRDKKQLQEAMDKNLCQLIQHIAAMIETQVGIHRPRTQRTRCAIIISVYLRSFLLVHY